jgi:peptidoglycan hydrolase CwlO-like protein
VISVLDGLPSGPSFTAPTEDFGSEKQKLSTRSRAIDERQAQSGDLSSPVNALRARINDLRTDVDDLKTKAGQVPPELSSIPGQLTDVRGQVDDARSQLIGVRTQMANVLKQVSGLDTRVGDAQTHVCDVEGKVGKFATQMNEAETQMNAIQARSGDLEAQMSNVKGQMGDMQVTSSATRGRLEEVAAEAKGTSGELAAVKAQLADLADHLREIDGELADVRSQQEQLHVSAPAPQSLYIPTRQGGQVVNRQIILTPVIFTPLYITSPNVSYIRGKPMPDDTLRPATPWRNVLDDSSTAVRSRQLSRKRPRNEPQPADLSDDAAPPSEATPVPRGEKPPIPQPREAPKQTHQRGQTLSRRASFLVIRPPLQLPQVPPQPQHPGDASKAEPPSDASKLQRTSDMSQPQFPDQDGQAALPWSPADLANEVPPLPADGSAPFPTVTSLPRPSPAPPHEVVANEPEEEPQARTEEKALEEEDFSNTVSIEQLLEPKFHKIDDDIGAQDHQLGLLRQAVSELRSTVQGMKAAAMRPAMSSSEKPWRIPETPALPSEAEPAAPVPLQPDHGVIRALRRQLEAQARDCWEEFHGIHKELMEIRQVQAAIPTVTERIIHVPVPVAPQPAPVHREEIIEAPPSPSSSPRDVLTVKPISVPPLPIGRTPTPLRIDPPRERSGGTQPRPVARPRVESEPPFPNGMSKPPPRENPAAPQVSSPHETGHPVLRPVPQQIEELLVLTPNDEIEARIVNLLIDIRTQLQLQLDHNTTRLNAIEPQIEAFVDKDYVQKFFRKIRFAITELAEQVAVVRQALPERVTKAELEEVAGDLFRSFTQESETSGGSVSMRCLLCGRPKAAVSGMIRDTRVAEALGDPPETSVAGLSNPSGRSRGTMLYGADKKLYRGRANLGRPAVASALENRRNLPVLERKP